MFGHDYLFSASASNRFILIRSFISLIVSSLQTLYSDCHISFSRSWSFSLNCNSVIISLIVCVYIFGVGR